MSNLKKAKIWHIFPKDGPTSILKPENGSTPKKAIHHIFTKEGPPSVTRNDDDGDLTLQNIICRHFNKQSPSSSLSVINDKTNDSTPTIAGYEIDGLVLTPPEETSSTSSTNTTIFNEVELEIFQDDNEVIEEAEPKITKTCHILQLSDSVILRIFKWLSIASLVQVSQTCKQLHSLAAESEVWENLDAAISNFGAEQLAALIRKPLKYLRLASATVKGPQSFLPGTSITPTPQCNASNLLHLDLSYASIDEETLQNFICLCTNLTKLSLEGMSLGNALFDQLTPSIETLNLCMTSNFELKHLYCYLQVNHKLTILNIGWIQQSRTSTKIEMMKLINSLPYGLEQLNISGYRHLLDNFHFAAMVDNCPDLTRLDISDSYELNRLAVLSIMKLVKLKHLAMNRCFKIGLLSLAPLKGLNSLETIEVFGFHSGGCTIRKMTSMLQVAINTYPFLNIGRPSSDCAPYYIWKKLVVPAVLKPQYALKHVLDTN